MQKSPTKETYILQRDIYLSDISLHMIHITSDMGCYMYPMKTDVCVCVCVCACVCVCICRLMSDMGWLRLVGCLKIYVSLQNIGLFCRALLQKRPILLSILLIVATPYQDLCIMRESPWLSATITLYNNDSLYVMYQRSVYIYTHTLIPLSNNDSLYVIPACVQPRLRLRCR